jgi:hypothetical protein
MKLVRCDICLGEGTTEGPPQGPIAPSPGWGHLTLVRMADQRQVVESAAERVVEQAEEVLAEDSAKALIRFGARMLTQGGMPGYDPSVHCACIDLCPRCLAELTVHVRGNPIADVERARTAGDNH